MDQDADVMRDIPGVDCHDQGTARCTFQPCLRSRASLCHIIEWPRAGLPTFVPYVGERAEWRVVPWMSEVRHLP